MFVIFDTNVIVQDFKFNSENFRILKECSYKYGIKMFVSEVVIDEVTRKYKEKLIAFNNDNKEYFHILPGKYLNRISDEAIDGLVKEYRRYLEDYLLSYNDYGTRCISADYKDFVAVYDKAINKVKPFSSNGKGFKAALIWEALKWIVLTYCNSEKKLAFITNNIVDFSDKEKINDSKWYIPSKGLREEYTSEGYPEDTIRIYESVNTFNIDVIFKKNKAFDAIKSSFNNAAKQNIFNKLKQEVFSYYINYDDDFEYKVTKVDNVEVVDAHNNYGSAIDEIILSVELDVYCEPIRHYLEPFWAKGELFINTDINTYEIKDIIELNISIKE